MKVSDLSYIHNEGCGKVAFYYDHMPTVDEIVMSRHATLLDGSHPHGGDHIICGSCKERIRPRLSVANLSEVSP